MSVRVEHGDCREIIPALGVTVDAVVCDPPYNLEAMAKRFAPGQKAATSPDHQRFAKGFMGMTWDSDVAFQPETWVTIGSALRPGGFLVAFGGTRTYHRLASAIENAGFVIQDCLMWLFATGFPKRRDMLKPAYEPIVLAYKPGGKRTLQVDECRIGTTVETWPVSRSYAAGQMQPGGKGQTQSTGEAPAGRWPANICHDGSDEVVALFPESETRRAVVTSKPGQIYGGGKGLPSHTGEYGFDDSGSNARFFFSAKAGTQDRWGSKHPTVKPVELMKWLVALVTPPGGTVLDCFAGSGTTAVAALATGRSAILIEREDQYIADIRERLAFYEGTGMHSMQAKNRNRGNGVGALRDGNRGRPVADHGPLFNLSTDGCRPVEAAPPNTDESKQYDPDLDALESYNAAVTAIGERWKQGAPIPESMLSRKVRP